MQARRKDACRKTMANKKSLTLTFVEERETKNTIRFTEQVADLDSPLIGTIYVSKHALKELGWARGNELTMTIE